MTTIPNAIAMASLLHNMLIYVLILGMLVTYQSSLGMDLWKSTNKLIRYLLGTKDYKLKYWSFDRLLWHIDPWFTISLSSTIIMHYFLGFLVTTSLNGISWIESIDYFAICRDFFFLTSQEPIISNLILIGWVQVVSNMDCVSSSSKTENWLGWVWYLAGP